MVEHLHPAHHGHGQEAAPIIMLLSCYCPQVRLLLATCPRLGRLGRLVHLAGADRRSFLELEEEARSSNWELDLVWVTPSSQ